MVYSSYDITQTIRKKEKHSIETSQNWSPQIINHLNEKKYDHTLVEGIQCNSKIISKHPRSFGEKKDGLKKEEETIVVGKGKGVVTKQPTNAWWQVTRSSCHPYGTVQQKVGMCGECHLWWMRKKFTCGWQSHAVNHKCHQSPSAITHTPLVMHAT